ncbi:MAG: YlxR family protein [Desulfosoma sp.]|uniref:YlxR family protein n=1 Tax=Desulfosoma sp. TaxID=2603217 RepID=UPI00404A8E6F
MQRRGHTPYRTCVVCRTKRPKKDLVRLVLNGHRLVIPDLRQRLSGRGAYVCPTCLDGVSTCKGLSRAFRGRLQGLSPSLLRQTLHLHTELTGCKNTEDPSLCVHKTTTRPRPASGDTAVEDF